MKALNDIRVEMGALALDDDATGLVEGESGFVDALAGQGIEDVGQGHQAGGDRDVVAGQTVRVAAAIPFFMVRAGDQLGDGEKADRLGGVGFGLGDGVATEDGMGFHDFPLVRAPACPA